MEIAINIALERMEKPNDSELAVGGQIGQAVFGKPIEKRHCRRGKFLSIAPS